MEPIPNNSNTNNTLNNGNIEIPATINNPDYQKPEIQLPKTETLPAVDLKHNQPITSIVNTILPSVSTTSDASSAAQSTNGNNTIFPSIASEINLEPAWIEAAKKIIEKTSDDPHNRQEQVASLKKDYQRKRNGDVK